MGGDFRAGALCALTGCGLVTLFIAGWAPAAFVVFFGWLAGCALSGLLWLAHYCYQSRARR